MLGRRYFVYMIQSSSRRALYIGSTNFLIMRVIEHRRGEYPGSFTSKYRAWRLVYYEECGDSQVAKDRERQLKGWSRAKKNALVAKMNPKWRDLFSEWEEKYGLEFRLDGRITRKQQQPQGQQQRQGQQQAQGQQQRLGQQQHQNQPQDPSTPVSRAGESAREPSSAQDG